MASNGDVEKVKKVLIEHPEILLEVIKLHPHIVSEILRLGGIPLYNVATKDDIKLLIELIYKRFEDINKRFEDINKRFEDINKRFEDINKRFEDVNKRFEDLRYYVDKRIGFLEKLIVSFNIPILLAVIGILIKLLMG